VTQIDWGDDESSGNNNQVRVKCNVGEGEDCRQFSADHVLVTVSLGCLKATHRQLFRPCLPDPKAKAIECLQMGCVEKLFLVFEEPLPSDIVEGFCLLWEEGVVRQVRQNPKDHWYKSFNMFHEVFDQPNMLMSFITGSAARHMATLSIEEITSALQQKILDDVIGRYLSSHSETGKVSLPALSQVIVSSWGCVDSIGGGYAYAPMECSSPESCRNALATPLSRNGVPRVLFSGEALSPNFYGTFHACTLTAFQAVGQIVSGT